MGARSNDYLSRPFVKFVQFVAKNVFGCRVAALCLLWLISPQINFDPRFVHLRALEYPRRSTPPEPSPYFPPSVSSRGLLQNHRRDLQPDPVFHPGDMSSDPEACRSRQADRRDYAAPARLLVAT